MPLIKPKSGEDQKKFTDRCMGNPTMNNEFPKSKQRYAVCMSQWKAKGEENNLSFLNRIIRSKGMKSKTQRILNLNKIERMLEQAASTRNWSTVNRSKLPASCYLWSPDPKKKSTWKLPYREGAGGINEKTGMYRKAGPVNLSAIRAIMGAIGSADQGKPMSVPASVYKRAEALAKRHRIGKYKEKFFFGGLVISDAFKSLRVSLDVAVAKVFGKKSYVSDFSNTEVVIGFYGSDEAIDISPDARTYKKVKYKINKGNVEFVGDADDVAKVITYESAELTPEEFHKLLSVDAELRGKNG